MGGDGNRMVEVAYIFPGQGAQFVGMGKDLYDNFPSAKEVFDKANFFLKIDINPAIDSLFASYYISITALNATSTRRDDFVPATRVIHSGAERRSGSG